MADPICRWRNATPETVCEIVEELPKNEMPEDEFRDLMAKSKFGSEFFHTPYQLACQLALYFIDNDKIYHPRFKNNISIEEADKYLHHWFSLYYVPNPYTKKGFKEIERPLFFEQTLAENLKLNNESSNFQDLLKLTFKDKIGEIDILRNLINKYSTFLKVENDKISLTEKGKSKMEINIGRDDKKSFFKNFDEKNDSSVSPYTNPKQIIFYGVPGCGKSHKIEEMLKNPKEFKIESEEHQVIRTVFHPDYTNSDFIGQILPKVNSDKTVEYNFVPGPFTKILANAIKHSCNQYVLIIEEINRGNASSIFGETFQLLDRIKKGQTIREKAGDGALNTYGKGWSEYFFMDDDINHYILKECNGNDTNKSADVNGIHFSENTGIRLPPNLSILATMNTSDQNVFMLDNAFQRRWKMEYIPNNIKYDDMEDSQKNQYGLKIGETNIKWGVFRDKINERISDSKISFSNAEDKQLGLFFIKADSETDTAEKLPETDKPEKIPESDFANKVLKYLWNDIFKRNPEEIFLADIKNFGDLLLKFNGKDAFGHCFDANLVAKLKEGNNPLSYQPKQTEKPETSE